MRHPVRPEETTRPPDARRRHTHLAVRTGGRNAGGFMKLAMLLVIALALWSTSGCAPAQQATRTAATAASPATQLRVQVDSNYPAPIVVFLVDAGIKVRLGMVLGMTSEVFHVRGAVVHADRELRLIVEPLGAAYVYVSEVIRVSGGQSVKLQVATHVLLSQHSIR
jgi:hypothetical protein